ncbi:MAG: hypothetical protein HY428_00940 [Candidatus Levybacteria bacterium]|nr:hypothetical protein [Candidatus Levybacteria bacterium]
MNNWQIAQLLRNVAASYGIKDEKKHYFQIIAYQKAADTIEESPTEVKDLVKEGKIEELQGVGPSIRKHLEELMKKGNVQYFSTVMATIPQAVFPLLNIPSFGPKKAYKLVTHFKLNNPVTVIADLKKIADRGKIAELEGFGKKSEELVLQAIKEYEEGVKKNVRMVLPYAYGIAEKMLSYLKKSPHVREAHPLGSLRRMRDTIGDVDIAVASSAPSEVLDHFVAYPHKERVLEKGPTTASLLISGGKHIDLMVQPPERFGALLQHFTGSKEHNIALREYALKKGLSLSERGIKKVGKAEIQSFDSEEKFYKALGLSWVPPEIREDTGEIELAIKNKLPDLIEPKDIKGDFHLHSSFPIEPSHDMGRSSMQEMIDKAKKLKYNYISFSEHNPSVSQHSKQQIYEIMTKRSKEIDRIRKNNKNIHIYSFLEIDILANGKLALDEKSFSMLDGCLVSIHSSFSMNKTDMTKRVLEGLSHPKAKVLSHPTGRLLNQRTGYDLEWDTIFDFCAKNNKALEINSWPERLDLPDRLVREAIKYGVKFFIDTDSHEVSQMDLMKFGVAVARRGWATKDDIINSFEYNKLDKWIKSQK